MGGGSRRRRQPSLWGCPRGRGPSCQARPVSGRSRRHHLRHRAGGTSRNGGPQAGHTRRRGRLFPRPGLSRAATSKHDNRWPIGRRKRSPEGAGRQRRDQARWARDPRPRVTVGAVEGSVDRGVGRLEITRGSSHGERHLPSANAWGSGRPGAQRFAALWVAKEGGRRRLGWRRRRGGAGRTVPQTRDRQELQTSSKAPTDPAEESTGGSGGGSRRGAPDPGGGPCPLLRHVLLAQPEELAGRAGAVRQPLRKPGVEAAPLPGRRGRGGSPRVRSRHLRRSGSETESRRRLAGWRAAGARRHGAQRPPSQPRMPVRAGGCHPALEQRPRRAVSHERAEPLPAEDPRDPTHGGHTGIQGTKQGRHQPGRMSAERASWGQGAAAGGALGQRRAQGPRHGARWHTCKCSGAVTGNDRLGEQRCTGWQGLGEQRNSCREGSPPYPPQHMTSSQSGRAPPLSQPGRAPRRKPGCGLLAPAADTATTPPQRGRSGRLAGGREPNSSSNPHRARSTRPHGCTWGRVRGPGPAGHGGRTGRPQRGTTIRIHGAWQGRRLRKGKGAVRARLVGRRDTPNTAAERWARGQQHLSPPSAGEGDGRAPGTTRSGEPGPRRPANSSA